MELKLGATIKKLRTERGITQEELANKIGVSFQAVSKWETNTTTPDISIIPQLALFFRVSIDSLFAINKDDYMERISNKSNFPKRHLALLFLSRPNQYNNLFL